jgi:DNA-binding transcriptional LysR family regulator
LAVVDIHRLRVLRSVVVAGSVSGAAATLGYSPSAISQHLTALQRETGLRLVERQGRGITITPAGRVLAAEAERVLASLGGIDSLVADLRSGRAGSLSIGYFASAGTAWIPAVVGLLVTDYPDLRLDLRLNDVGGDGTTTADVEIVVGGSHDRALERYRLRHLLDDPYVAVLPAGHEAAGTSALALGQLATHRWVDTNDQGYCRQVMLDACAQAGFVPQFRVEAPDYATAIAFVAAGVGVAIIPALGLGALPAGVVTVPLVDPTPVRRISVGVRPAAERHAAAQRTVELLHALVASRRKADARQPVA